MVERGFALVVVAEVWAAAAAAASVARFCNCKAFMPAGWGKREATSAIGPLHPFPKREGRGHGQRAPGWHTRPSCPGDSCVTTQPVPTQHPLPNASSQAAQVILKDRQRVSAWTMDGRAFPLVAVRNCEIRARTAGVSGETLHP